MCRINSIMDFKYSENYIPPSVNGLFWIVFAVSASCVFSIAVVYLISRIMRYCYNTPYEDELRTTVGYKERVPSTQRQEMISSINSDEME